jgi:hypothetical protein
MDAVRIAALGALDLAASTAYATQAHACMMCVSLGCSRDCPRSGAQIARQENLALWSPPAPWCIFLVLLLRSISVRKERLHPTKSPGRVRVKGCKGQQHTPGRACKRRHDGIEAERACTSSRVDIASVTRRGLSCARAWVREENRREEGGAARPLARWASCVRVWRARDISVRTSSRGTTAYSR